MIELYHNDMSVCAQKVRFALGEKALQWKSRHLNLRAGDQQKPGYVKLNPNAVVPTHAVAALITGSSHAKRDRLFPFGKPSSLVDCDR